MQLMEERQQHEAAVAEYKQVHTEHYDCVAMTKSLLDCLSTNKLDIQVFQRLDEGHQKQLEELSQELLEVKVRQSFPRKFRLDILL